MLAECAASAADLLLFLDPPRSKTAKETFKAQGPSVARHGEAPSKRGSNEASVSRSAFLGRERNWTPDGAKSCGRLSILFRM